MAVRWQGLGLDNRRFLRYNNSTFQPISFESKRKVSLKNVFISEIVFSKERRYKKRKKEKYD